MVVKQQNCISDKEMIKKSQYFFSFSFIYLAIYFAAASSRMVVG